MNDDWARLWLFVHDFDPDDAIDTHVGFLLLADDDDDRADGRGECEEEYLTAIGYASHCGEIAVVSYLIRNGADLNLLSDEGKSSLFLSATQGCLDVAKLLVSNGESRTHLSLRDHHDRTPLETAARGGHLEFCQWLVQNGAESTLCSDLSGSSGPLHAACRAKQRSLQVVQWLLTTEARKDATHAVDLGSDDNADEDIEDDDQEYDDDESHNHQLRTPLSIAVNCSNLNVAEILLLDIGVWSDDTGEVNIQTARRDLPVGTPKDESWARWYQLVGFMHSRLDLRAAFIDTFLIGVHYGKASKLPLATASPLSKLALGEATGTSLLKLIADFAGVPYGRHLRHLRDVFFTIAFVQGERSL